MHTRVAIIGSGPAGLTAALYAARASLEPLVIRGLQPGGLIATTSEVENYPGFVDGIGGYELSDNMEKQAMRFGAKFKDTLITSIDASQRPFVLHTDDGEPITADTITFTIIITIRITITIVIIIIIIIIIVIIIITA